ncbi:hypothetical protein LSH36_1134g01001 [Paralvinella palmiformis]|uniref:Angiomotin C-terminal domain-containing protein n=1 Tax=Paralvinella palmiformis TaxID=53620 RepID=A0AAD9MRB9_9ANNE|nr:hypothetical protein LSH36_1134g01001 [Paralvinella palmiformis]
MMQAANQSNKHLAGIHCNNTYHYREPPPYPGLTRPFYQPGFRQSYSGSETSTDLSLSSCENLSSSVRQEPQGEETNAVVTCPLEPTQDRNANCGGLCHTTQSQMEIDQKPGFEVKSANSSTFYVTGNVPQPKMSVGIGSHDRYVVNSSHGNHSSNHGNPKLSASVNNNSNNNNNNNNCSIGDVLNSVQLAMSPQMPKARTMMSQYQTDAMRSLCQQMCNQQIQHPGSPSCSPLLAKGPSSLKVSSPTPATSPAPQQNQHQQHQQQSELSKTLPNGKESPVLGSNAGFPHTDSSPSLSQLISVLSRHSTNQNSLPSSARDRQRPSTAPTMRHLSTAPTSQPYSGYSTDICRSQDRVERSSLQRSQPDLTHLAELSIVSQQRDVGAPSSEDEPKVSRPSNLKINLENGTNMQSQMLGSISNHGNRTGRGNQTTMVQPSLQQGQVTSSTSSSLPSSLQQQQLSYLHSCHLQANGGPKAAQDVQAQVTGQSMTASSSPVPCTDTTATMSMVFGSSTSSPDRLHPGSQSPNLRKLCDVDYVAVPGHASQVVDHAAIATRATQMVERLSEENRSLRQELEGYYKKVYRLQKLELEIQKVHENYETLVKHSHKQQSLEKLIRLKLEAEVKKLCDTNKELKDQLDKALRQLQQKETYTMLDSEIRKELLGKDSLIVKLISQNQDLTATKEQLEMEFATQKSTMHDQSLHLKLLDSALSSARSDVMKYEEQMENRKAEEDKVAELQRALTQLQLAVEKRESIEQKLRQKLEEEVQYLRNQQAGMNKMTDADEGISSDSESPTSLQSLLRQITEKEQRILMLEADVAKVIVVVLYLWKQKYLEETALRQFAVNAASVSKDARIASLEHSSLETEKLMAEARNDRMKQMDEVHLANRKCAELEAKLKTVQAQLAEKDAMIRLLQNRVPISRTSSITSLIGSPLHSPHPSINSSSSLGSPIMNTHSHTSTPSCGSSRQNSQLDDVSCGGNGAGGGNGIGCKTWEGKHPVHSKSNSTGSAVSSLSCSAKEAQLLELKQKLAVQAALFGNIQSGSDQLKKYLWQNHCHGDVRCVLLLQCVLATVAGSFCAAMANPCVRVNMTAPDVFSPGNFDSKNPIWFPESRFLIKASGVCPGVSTLSQHLIFAISGMYAVS